MKFPDVLAILCVFSGIFPLATVTCLAFRAASNKRQTNRQLSTALSARAFTESSIKSTEEVNSVHHQCRYCNASFASRNALFRHVRSDPTCSRLANDGNQYSQLRSPKRQRIALEFQYCSSVPATKADQKCSPDETTTTSEAVLAGNALRRAVEQAITTFVHNNPQLKECTIEISSMTQASVSNLRHCSLAQEVGCAAAADVMVLSFVAPAAVTSSTDLEDYNRQTYFLNTLLESVNVILQGTTDSSDWVDMTLLSCKLLSSDSRLHAERSCTQRIYHYLMPIRWLPGGTELEHWWMRSEQHERLSASDRANHHESRVQSRPPNDTLLLLKNALRSAESDTVTKSSSQGRDAAGRFGTLANKIKRPWHNFAAPQLRGDASPNNEPVWRVVDRARLIKLQTWNDQVFAVLEFRGDDFLPEQVRRIIGTAVAMTHEWLPLETFDLLTRPDVFIEAPLAPEGHLYLEAVRFHFDELRTKGQGIFDNEEDGLVAKHSDETESSETGSSSTIQEHLLQRLSDDAVQRREDLWLRDLRDMVAPRIRQRLVHASQVDETIRLESTKDLKPASPCYGRALELLRQIVASGQWPATSTARSNVIRESNDKRGSFSVVNPKFRRDSDEDSLPLGNSLFPELVEAVFDLELALSKMCVDCATADGVANTQSACRRQISSHCAINCNAQFNPHVDSGRGAGQSLSMIVGLGDYVGGELAVEGTGHDIRYLPLQFDGWRLRHWTLPFAGERFSLVWFTPEIKGKG